MMSRLLPLPLLLLAACGADTSLLSQPPANEVPPTIHPPTMPPPAKGNAFVNGCPLTGWSARSLGYGVIPGPPEYSPNGALLSHPMSIYLQGSQYARRFDGSAAGSMSNGPEARSQDWNWEAWRTGDEVVLQDSTRPEVQHRWPARRSSGEHLLQFALTPEGSRFVLIFFAEEATRLEVWRSEDAVLERSIMLEGASRSAWREAQRLHPVDEQKLFVLGDGQVLGVDLSTGEVLRSQTLATETPPRAGGALISLAINRSQNLIAVTTSENELHLLSALSLEAQAEPWPSFSFIANQDIYAPPLAASPVAWSPDGLAIAYLDPEGAVVVQGLSSGDELRRFPAPELEPEQWQEPFAVGLAFSPDGSGLAMAHQSRMDAVDCVGSQLEPGGELEVTVQGPQEVRLGERVEFEVEVANAQSYWVTQLAHEDQITPAETRSTIVWGAYPEGQVSLEFQIDDGFRRSVVRRTITVLPAE